MRVHALRALADADVVAYLHPLPDYPAPPLQQVAQLERPPRGAIVTVYTKADLVRPRPPGGPGGSDGVALSAGTGQGLQDLLRGLRAPRPARPRPSPAPRTRPHAP